MPDEAPRPAVRSHWNCKPVGSPPRKCSKNPSTRENYLNQENVTLLLVTHDRYFLDAVSEEIWEISPGPGGEAGALFIHKGDYANYLEKKAARIESDTASIDKAKNLYRKELEWMRKQPKARTTTGDSS